MSEGIQAFYETAKAREFARDFQFRLVTLGPLSKDDLVYVRTTSLPGKSIVDNVVPYMGLDFHVPGGSKYPGSLPVKFLCDEAINVRSKLEAWMTEIFSVDTSSGKYGVPAEIATLDLLDKEFKAVRRYEFVGIYIQNLGDINYDIGGGGKPQEFDATINYQWWRPV